MRWLDSLHLSPAGKDGQNTMDNEDSVLDPKVSRAYPRLYDDRTLLDHPRRDHASTAETTSSP